MTTSAPELPDWTVSPFTADGVAHPVYRREPTTGRGPGVIVMHELPGITPQVLDFANEVVAAGFTVFMPSLFGTPGAATGPVTLTRALTQVCVSREFTVLATGRTSRVADWLRSLAAAAHAELGGPGVGAVGMCFTGGFALAMMVDAPVIAAVVAQPSLPFAFGAARAADINLNQSDTAAVVRRVAAGCQVRAFAYESDWRVGTRLDTMTEVLGAPNFLKVQLPGKGHSTLTANRDETSVAQVLAFLTDQLQTGP